MVGTNRQYYYRSFWIKESKQQKAEQVIFPNEKGKVYLTQSMLTPEEVEMILFAGFGTHEGRGKNMIIFYVTASQRAMIVKDLANIHEYYYVGGSLRISGQILYSGPNINN